MGEFAVIIVIGVAVVVFALCRELICWYFKINEYLSEFRSYRADVRAIRQILTTQFGAPVHADRDIANMSFDDMTILAEQMGLEPEKLPSKLEAQLLAAQAAASPPVKDAGEGRAN